jgi:hypothetical protein
MPGFNRFYFSAEAIEHGELTGDDLVAKRNYNPVTDSGKLA